MLQDQLLRLWTSAKKTVVFITHDLVEAIALADRVVVMTSRPGRLKCVAGVPIPRPRDVYRIHQNREFSEIYERLWNELRPEVHLEESCLRESTSQTREHMKALGGKAYWDQFPRAHLPTWEPLC